MKSEVLPPIRVTSEFRRQAEQVLGPDETMSSFVTEAVKTAVERRKINQLFYDRGIEAGLDARARDAYRTADQVLAQLEEIAAKYEGKA